MYSGKYNDIIFLNENNISISTLPSYIYSTICTIYPGWWDVSEIIKELRGCNDTHNTKITSAGRCVCVGQVSS